MNVIQADLGEQLHAANGECPFQLTRDEKGDDERIYAAGDSPGNGFDQATMMSVGHVQTIGKRLVESTHVESAPNLLRALTGGF